MLEANVVLMKRFIYFFLLSLSCLRGGCVSVGGLYLAEGSWSPHSRPRCSESVGCGGPERLTLTSNPLAVAAGLAPLNKSTGLCARKSRPARVSSGPVVRSPAPQGEPHHIIQRTPETRGHSTR